MFKKVLVGMLTASMVVLASGCDKNTSKDSAEAIVESVVESAVESVAESVEESAVEKIDAADDAEVTDDAMNDEEADDMQGADDADGDNADANDAEADGADADGANEDAQVNIVGVYVKEYTDELDGQEVSGEYTYTFNEDHTGVAEIQDTIEFTWNDNKIIEGAYEYDFTIEDGVLKIERDGIVDEYVKKN